MNIVLLILVIKIINYFIYVDFIKVLCIEIQQHIIYAHKL